MIPSLFIFNRLTEVSINNDNFQNFIYLPYELQIKILVVDHVSLPSKLLINIV